MPIRKLAAAQLCPAVAGVFAHVYGCAIYPPNRKQPYECKHSTAVIYFAVAWLCSGKHI